ncbi:hypothetical protein ON010_g5237 [Phytophthora cinnamomi]|nr:hypothetical protein ON010_g5237 [Phytophthora cinnamomi]
MKLVLQAVSKGDPEGPWEIVHTQNGSNLHNHTPSEDARVHSCHCRHAVVAETSTGTTRSVQESADPDSFVILKGIANTKNAVRRRVLATNTVMEALCGPLRTWFLLSLRSKPEDTRTAACMNAVDRVLPEMPAMVCRWPMNTNVEVMARKHLGQVTMVDLITGDKTKVTTWETDAFMVTFHKTVDSRTESEFETRSKRELFELGRAGMHTLISRSDLDTVFKGLLPWWKAAAADTRLISERNGDITPAVLQPNQCAAVVRVITV